MSSAFAVFAVVAFGAFVLSVVQGNGALYELLAGAGLCLAIAEALNYLSRIAARMDQVGDEAAARLADRAQLEAANKLQAESAKYRAEVRQIAETLKP